MTDDQIQALLDDGKAEARHVGVLKKLDSGVYCIHRSWGFGKVASFDPIMGKFQIDFRGRPGHSMEARYAAESLEILPAEHILVQKVTRLDTLKQLAIGEPLQLLRIVLGSFGGQGVADSIAAALCPEVVAAADWKKWWDGAKRAMKKDPHFGVPAKKTEPFVLRDKPQRPEEELLRSFASAVNLRQKLQVAEQLLRIADQLPDVPTVLGPVIHALSDEIEASSHRDPITTLEAIWVRDELAGLCGHQTPHTVEQIHEVIRNVRHLGELLQSLPSAKQKRLLPHLRTAYPDTWHDTLRQVLLSADVKLVGDIIEFLINEGQIDAVRAFLDRSIREQSAVGDLLLWICRSRNQPAFAETIGPVLNVRLASAILQSIQRGQTETGRKKNLLLEYLVNDPTLLGELLHETDIEDVRDIARKLLLHQAIGEIDRRSLLARIIKIHPPIQSLLTSGGETRQQTITVSWESLEQRKAEYDELVSKRIPANTRDITIARSYGDLRENFEFKAAKEMQKVLMARKGELELMLANSRGTDFADAKGDAVGIGTVVTLTDLTENKTVRYAILGAWDSDVDRGIISYQTTLAQALLNKKVGEEADFEIGDHRHHVGVEKIERYVDLKSEIGPPCIVRPIGAGGESTSAPAAPASN
ncbi:MAG: GreA/GreB family elongation factor [Verrucomicrobia bacterium]|nr:GreA/GreB family elongation factor [Verrucomicrobiota bacterium]